MTIRDSRFRTHYNAVVVAVARNGERLHQKIGDIVLHPGDVLLVEAHPSFADQHRGSRDFFLVSKIDESSPPRHELALLAVGLLIGDGGARLGLACTSMLVAALVAGGLMLVTRCVSLETARKSIDWEVLLAIAASFALGTALEKTGAAKQIAESAIATCRRQPVGFAGDHLFHHARRHRADHQQRGRGPDVSLRHGNRQHAWSVSYLPFVIA